MDASRTTVFSQHRTLHSCTQLREDGLRPSLPLSVSARCWAITGPQWMAAYAVIHHKISITVIDRESVILQGVGNPRSLFFLHKRAYPNSKAGVGLFLFSFLKF